MAGRAGNRATVTFGTSGFTAKLLTADAGGFSRTEIDVTDMTDFGTDQSGTVQGSDWSNIIVHQYEAGSLTWAPVELTVNHDPDQILPLLKASELITFRAPEVGAQTTGAGMSFQGFATNYSPSYGMDGAVTASLSIRPTSEPTMLDAV